MPETTPRFLLISDAERSSTVSRWRFVLQPLDANHSPPVEAADMEPAILGERLELLAVVRGLEALSQPSHVTLLTTSRYVSRGLHYGLAEWRSNGWQWEHFGTMTPVKNGDLWRRLDRALEFHQVDCRLLRFDLTHACGADETAGELAQDPAAPMDSRPAPVRRPHFLNQRGLAQAPVTNVPSVPALAAVSDAVATPHRMPATNAFSSPAKHTWRPLARFRRRRAKWIVRVGRKCDALWLRFRQLGSPFLLPPWLEG